MSTDTQQKWTPEQIKYIQFVARGKTTVGGDKRNDEQFAQAIGVDRTTLWRWSKLSGFRQAVFEEVLDDNLEYVKPLLRAQTAGGIKKGKGGDPASANLVLKAYGMLTERHDHTTNGKDMPSPILNATTKVD